MPLGSVTVNAAAGILHVNRFYSHLLLLLLLVPLVGCSTKAHPPLRKGESMHLYVNLPTESAYWVEDLHRSVGRYGFQNEEMRLEGVTRFLYQMRAVQRTRTGETRLAITPRFYTIDDWFVTPDGFRKRPPQMEVLFNQIETVVRNHPFTITLGANGSVVDSDGLTELEDALAGVVGRHDLEFSDLTPPEQQAWRRVFMSHIDERPIRAHFDRAFGFLPSGYVRLGDRWVESPTYKPWPFLPTEHSVRLIDRQGDHFLVETEAVFMPPKESNWASYKGNATGTIHLDTETRLGLAQQETTHWKRKRKRTPWEQFTLKSLEASRTVRITPGPISESPHLNAIHRFPFLEQTPAKASPR